MLAPVYGLFTDETDAADVLRAASAEVVVGDLLEQADVHRGVTPQ